MIAFNELKEWAGAILCHPWDGDTDKRPPSLQDRAYLTEAQLRALPEWLQMPHVQPLSLRKCADAAGHYTPANQLAQLALSIKDDRGVLVAFCGWVQTERGDVRIYLLPDRTARELRFILDSHADATAKQLMQSIVSGPNVDC